MIGRITGILILKQAPHLLIDVNGVAYEIQASMHTFYQLPEMGQKVTLHIHFVVREDAQLLYGFYDLHERSLFRKLIKISGVGPKLALTILSSITADEFIRLVSDGSVGNLTRIPGVGKKTAERLIIEMKDKFKDLADFEGANPDLPFSNMMQSEKTAVQEAISALESLGYKSQEASKVIQKLNQPDLSSEELIRLALKGMVR